MKTLEAAISLTIGRTIPWITYAQGILLKTLLMTTEEVMLVSTS